MTVHWQESCNLHVPQQKHLTTPLCRNNRQQGCHGQGKVREKQIFQGEGKVRENLGYHQSE